MKKLVTKGNMLSATLVGTLLLFAIFFGARTESCYQSVFCHNFSADFAIDVVLFICFFALFLLPFSLITYKMRDEVFEHWVKFVVWGVPILMILTFLILGGASGGGYLGMGGAFDALLLVLLYGIFCGVSLWRIVSKYGQLKHWDK